MMKPEMAKDEDAMIREACGRLPESRISPAFSSRVMASVEATRQFDSISPYGLPSLGRFELIGGLTGLLAGVMLILLVVVKLDADPGKLRQGRAPEPLSVSALGTPLESFLWSNPASPATGERDR
jgi:hypothetical protein